ncbi:MAG: hypothetical protein F4014_03410, partial [Gemmatimonadetes bacterium]|nr:hypothetical protein [Gemmatimonadota bacterium]
MALSDFTGPDYINAWTGDLDQRWPERAAMAYCVVRTLVEWRGEQRERERHRAESPGSDHLATTRLLELGVGAGGLAQAVLSALFDGSESGRTSAVEYTGIEIEPALALHLDELLAKSGY